MRKLKLDDNALRKLLDELDIQDMRAPDAAQFFSYRLPNLRIDFDFSRDESTRLMVPSRRLGPRGVYFLTASLIHNECTCRVHLVTVRNNWQTVAGRVAGCRYLPGANGVYEVFVEFERLIDPGTFAASASHTRILAIDDSLVSQQLYQRLFDSLNVDLVCASSAVEGVKRALSDTFDVVLMDLEMPEMDGVTATRLLRGKGYMRSIVAVSARTQPEDRDMARDAGCDDFLPKPITRAVLLQVVARNKPEPLVSALLDDPSMADLIDRFVDSLRRTITQLEAAYGRQSAEDLEREVRSLKGEAAGIGFQPITDAAESLEATLRKGVELDQVRHTLIELIRLCMSARPASNRSSIAAVASDDESVSAQAEQKTDQG